MYHPKDPWDFYVCPRCYGKRPTFQSKRFGVLYAPLIPLKFGPEHTRVYLARLKPKPVVREPWIIVPNKPIQLTLF